MLNDFSEQDIASVTEWLTKILDLIRKFLFAILIGKKAKWYLWHIGFETILPSYTVKKMAEGWGI